MAAVLVVDDDPDLRLRRVTWQRCAGHDVAGLGSGEEALARTTTAGAPDVVLDVITGAPVPRTPAASGDHRAG